MGYALRLLSHGRERSRIIAGSLKDWKPDPSSVPRTSETDSDTSLP